VRDREAPDRRQVGDGFPFVGPVPGLNGVVACGYGTFGLGWAVLAARWAVEALVSGRIPRLALQGQPRRRRMKS